MNSSSSNSNTVPHGDPQDFLPATIHAIFAMKSMAYAAKSNPAYLPHLIGIAQTIDVNEIANFSIGAPTSSDKAPSSGVVAESVRSPIESKAVPHESYPNLGLSEGDNMPPLPKKARTVPASCYTKNNYTSNGMSRDPIIGNEPDLQLLETDCKSQASGFPADYSRQPIPDHKRASIPTTSIISSSELANSIDVSSPITSLLVLDLYIKKCLSTYTTSVFNDTSSSIIEEFIELMNLCCATVGERSCPFQDQSLLIFDQSANQTGRDITKSELGFDKIKYPSSRSISSLLVMERSSSHWQLYLGTKFGTRDHMSVPTCLLARIIRSIDSSRSCNGLNESTFTFISSKVPSFSCPDFGFYYSLIYMSDISDLLMKTAIESTRTLARKNGPGERKKSKRGKTTQFYQGLQNASAHTQYLARWSMLGNAKPIPSIKADRGPTDHDKENLLLFHHLSIELFISKFGFAPFEIPSSFSTAYKVSRCDLRIGLNRSLDPTGRIQRTHNFNQAESGEHFARKGNECLTNHSDTKNCPILDTTISLTTLHSVQDLLCDEVSFADVEKHFDISQGIVAANGIGYTRSCAHHHATTIANIQTALASDTTDDLTKLCIRLLTQTKCPIDYQGFFWENETSFDDMATELAVVLESENSKWIDTIRVYCGMDRKVLRSIACFDKYGFYSIFLHVLLSLHAHGFIVSKWDVRCLVYYFGLVQNGTSVLVAVWDDLVANKETYLPFLPTFREGQGEKCLLTLMLSCERRIRLVLAKKGRGKSLRESDHLMVKNKMGSNPFNRFMHGSNTSHMIVDTIDEHFVTLFQYIESNEVANEKSTKVKAELVLGRVQMIPGINSSRAMQFMHSCCLAGLLPLSCMQDFIRIEKNSSSADILELFYGNDCICSSEFNVLYLALKNNFGFTKITKFFLENMLHEMKSIAANGSPEGWRDVYWNRTFLLSEAYFEQAISANHSKNPDVYFEDRSTNKFQHLFRVKEGKLEMRLSTVRNDPGHTPISSIKLSYENNDTFTVDIGKHQLSDCFGT